MTYSSLMGILLWKTLFNYLNISFSFFFINFFHKQTQIEVTLILIAGMGESSHFSSRVESESFRNTFKSSRVESPVFTSRVKSSQIIFSILRFLFISIKILTSFFFRKCSKKYCKNYKKRMDVTK